MSSGSGIPLSSLPHFRGRDFVQTFRAYALARGNMVQAADVAAELYGYGALAARVNKAAIASGGLIPSAAWGSELGTFTNAASEFFAFVSERTVAGQLGRTRKLPLLTRLIALTSGSTAYWVGEGKAKLLSSPVFEASTLRPKKVGALIVATMELLQNSDPRSEAVLREDLARAMAQAIDQAFLDASGPGDDATPASIIDGAMSVPPSTGGSPSEDIAVLLSHLGADWIAPAFIMSGFAAAQVTSEKYPNVGFNGGEIAGIVVATSPYVPSGLLVLLDAASVAIAEGDSEVKISRDASIEMSNTPTQDALVPTGSTMVSLWQSNAVALLAERTINWRRMKPDSAVFMENVPWATPVTST